MNYKIDEGVPFPQQARGRPATYPWRDMQVGDSFVTSTYINCNRYSKNQKFTCRRVNDTQWRVWRIA